MLVHDFKERLNFSEGVEVSGNVLNAVAGMVSNATRIRRAEEKDDRNGTDFWIDRTHDLPPISLDVKHRSFCPIDRFNSDDACIETTSVYQGDNVLPYSDEGRKKIGWTLNYAKRTDYIVYTWPKGDKQRFWIVPFVPLCTAARVNWKQWAKEYGERMARNKDYLTLSVYPPRTVIAKSIRQLMDGQVRI